MCLAKQQGMQHIVLQTWLFPAGAFVKLPEGYKLLHLSKDPGAPGSKQGSGAWQVQQSCQHFMYW